MVYTYHGIILTKGKNNELLDKHYTWHASVRNYAVWKKQSPKNFIYKACMKWYIFGNGEPVSDCQEIMVSSIGYSIKREFTELIFSCARESASLYAKFVCLWLYIIEISLSSSVVFLLSIATHALIYSFNKQIQLA